MPDTSILLGVIGRAHGVRGLVRVTSHTEDPADLTAYGPLSDDRGRRFTLRWRGEGIVEVMELVDGVSVKVTDRTQAEKLTNTRLYIDRARLPPPEDEDEFYLVDLIGLAAAGADGVPLGRVAVVHDYGAGVSLEIARDGAPPLIVPFTRAAVPVVDVAGGQVTVCPPDDVVGEAADADPHGAAGSSPGPAMPRERASGSPEGDSRATSRGRSRPKDDAPGAEVSA